MLIPMQSVRDFLKNNFSHPHVIIGVVLFLVLSAHVASYVYMGVLAAKNPDAVPHPALRGDAIQYTELANSLIEQKGLEGSLFEERRHWPPGYPYFLVFSEKVGSWFGVKEWHFAVALQTFIALVAVFLVYRMARIFLPFPWAALPPLFYGLDPQVVLANTTTLSDGLGASLLIIIVYLALFFDARGFETARWGVVGLLLGYLVFMRPITQYLVLLGLCVLIFVLWRAYQKSGRNFFEPLAAYIITATVVLAPWLMWVHSKFGVYEMGHVSSVNMLYWNVRDFLAWEEINKDGFMPAILVNLHRDAQTFKDVDVYIRERLEDITPEGAWIQNYEWKLGIQIAKENLLHYTYFHLAYLLPFFFGSSLEVYQETAWQVAADQGLFSPVNYMTFHSTWKPIISRDWGMWFAILQLSVVLLEIAVWICIFLLALYAFLTMRRTYIVWIFVGLIAYFALMTGAAAIPRYRIPTEPYLLILATIGLHSIVQKVRAHRSRGAWGLWYTTGMKNGMMIFWVGVLLLVVAGIGASVLVKPGPGQLDSFAQCLTEKSATFYGAFWCPHCQAQKRMFGASAKLLPYVECSTPDGQGQLQVCKDKEIQQYPTWEFADGERLTGEVPLNQLAEKTGCVLPE